ncbi:MAG TPA: choice-of-anchor D domain-containing protein, partial [Candidatus Kapabacteria bacterium]
IAKPPCVSAKVPVLVHTPPCGRWSLDSVLLYNMGSVAQVLGGFDSILGPSQTDTIWIQTNGSVPGTTSGGVELFFHSLTNPLLYDTTLPAAVRILNSAPVVVAATSYYLSNCRTSIIPVLLQALNCDSVSIFSCTVTCKGANFTTDLTFPRILEIGEIDTLHVTIPPQSLSGPYEITIRVKGVSFGSIVGFDTTVTILVMFTTDSHALSVIPNSLSFDSISICNLALDTFRLTNVGCGPIVLTSDETQWPRGWSVLDPVFPDTLDADSSVTVQLQFQPYDLSSSQFSIEYAFDYGGGKTSAVELNVAAQVMPAPAQLTLSDTAIDFGTLRRCQTTAHDSVIVITNTGCDSLSLTRAFVVNGAGFTLNGGNDTTLPPHGSARYALHFSDSTVQNYASAFHVTGTGAHGGNEIDPSVPLVAAIVSGDRSASIAPDSILFGTTTLCEERDSFVTITNTGCEADTVLSASFSSDEFAFGPSVSFPDTLAPGASIPFPIVTHLDTTGHPNSVSALLSFVLDSGISLPAIPVLRAVTYPTRFSLSLAASPQSKVHAFDTVWIRRIGTIPSGVDELDFDLIYNDNLLEYAGKNESDILAGTGTVLANGLTSRTFQMKPASDRDTLATLSFQTYLTKELTTSIALANPKFFVSGALASACVASLDSSGGPSQFKLELSCGDSSILAAWNSSPPFTIESINPNPAEKEFQVTGSGFSKEMKIELYNVLGDVVISPQLPSSPLEPASFTLDVSQLAAGSYYLRVSVEGYTVTRPVSISR